MSDKDILRKRFSKQLNEVAAKYVASIPFDWRLYKHDIEGSIAHVEMLGKQGIITGEDAEVIINGLLLVKSEIESGKFDFRSELEDIHMNIESRLNELVGDVAGKMHTARSRNDQIALDIRMFFREVTENTIWAVNDLQKAIVEIAEANITVIMPGYTHLQQAQPVLFAHHMLAYFEMLKRDKMRFLDCMKRVDELPLGSGAMAGVSYQIDRDMVARKLGFSRVSMNSVDAVSDRDFLIEFEAAAAITAMHISRLAEEIIIWSSAEFAFVEIDDSFAMSSSIMPQKKNPDIAELARAKTGRLYGNLIGQLTVMKGLPLSYNRDLQEDKESFFDTVDTLSSTLEVIAGLIRTLRIDSRKMEDSAALNYVLATDFADYLVKKGLPFREAHSITAKLVQYAIEKCKKLEQLSMEELKTFSTLFDKDVKEIDLHYSLNIRDCIGGTSPNQVKLSIESAKKSVVEI